ncbi:MAG: toll/interleukin-1 receptor domain-containing protein [Phototrophicaceae bacterium]|jgi:hypothetical protein
MTDVRQTTVAQTVDAPTKDVLISYSRRNKTFVEGLVQRLRGAGRSVWIDWDDIPYSVDWWKQIRTAIDNAETVIVVISTDHASSYVCNLEVEYARRNNKRIVPLLYEYVNTELAEAAWEGKAWAQTARENQATLNALNWLFFNEEDGFEKSFDALQVTLDLDPEHVERHTRLLLRAKLWEQNNKNPSFLARGDELKEAEYWLKYNHDRSPFPTLLHMAFIEASTQDERRQKRLLSRLQAFTQIVIRFVTVTFFVGLGVGQHIYRIFLSADFLIQQRISNTLSIGVLVGGVLALGVIVLDELPSRLFPKWRGQEWMWARAVWYPLMGIVVAALTWTAYVWLFLSAPVPHWTHLLAISAGFGVGMLVPAVFRVPTWVYVVVMAACLWISFYISFESYWRVYIEGVAPRFPINLDTPIIAYNESFSQIYTIGIPMAALIALGVFWNDTVRALRRMFIYEETERSR